VHPLRRAHVPVAAHSAAARKTLAAAARAPAHDCNRPISIPQPRWDLITESSRDIPIVFCKRDPMFLVSQAYPPVVQKLLVLDHFVYVLDPSVSSFRARSPM
jgi:hypothetical protein